MAGTGMRKAAVSESEASWVSKVEVGVSELWLACCEVLLFADVPAVVAAGSDDNFVLVADKGVQGEVG